MTVGDLPRFCDIPRYSPAAPCRCGYDGEGVHRCHAGRDPRYPGARCGAEGEPRLAATAAGLPGTQIKVGVTVVVYCAEHAAEAGFAL